MLSARFKPYHVPLFLAKYAWLTARRRPILVHFEVTMRCNARCSFCDYWKTPADAKEHELKSFADAGYDRAIETAAREGIQLPMAGGATGADGNRNGT